MEARESEPGCGGDRSGDHRGVREELAAQSLHDLEPHGFGELLSTASEGGGIPKKGGGVRILGVPTVADRVAQTVVKESLEKMLEPHFDPDSYGYRPLRSAKDAVRVIRQRCWKYDWVLEFDVKGAFDNLDHDLLWKALRKHTDCKWVCCMFGDGSRRPRYPKAVRFIRAIAARRKAVSWVPC